MDCKMEVINNSPIGTHHQVDNPPVLLEITETNMILQKQPKRAK